MLELAMTSARLFDDIRDRNNLRCHGSVTIRVSRESEWHPVLQTLKCCHNSRPVSVFENHLNWAQFRRMLEKL